LDNRFEEALARPGTAQSFPFEDIHLHARAWTAPCPTAPKRDLLLLHGRNANHHWWSFIAPLLKTSGTVIAMDSSGSGDSGWRGGYSVGGFAREAIAVVRQAHLDDPIIIGHSFGGYVALKALELEPDLFSGLIIVDTRMAREKGEVETQPRLQARPKRTYPDFETIISRFRFLPEQGGLPEVIAYLAKHSVRQTEEGWVWKFHGGAIDMSDGVADMPSLRKRLDVLSGPVAYVWGSDSALIREADVVTARRLSAAVKIVEISGAGHHIMADQPEKLIDTVNGLLTLATP
jgi:pimeloyl-ACP methyl ester carboxylesterase